MELKWGSSPKQTLFLISYVALFLRASSDTVYKESMQNVTAPKNGTHKAVCPPSWVFGPNKTKCFGYFDNLTSWDQSETLCKHYGGHLASLPSDREAGFVLKICRKSVDGCWVGGRSSKAAEGLQWNWTDNSSLGWNMTVYPREPSCSGCGNSSSCHVEMCTLVTNSSTYIACERCNASHAFVCMVDTEFKCYHMHCHREYLIILAVASGLILFTTFSVVTWFLVHKRGKKRRKSRKPSNPSDAALVPPSWKIFTSEELRSMTKNFSEGINLIGNTKTGGTYRGVLSDGTKVAVKRLKRSSFQRKKEFYSEIRRVAKLHHPNLVSVQGCCYDHGDRFIVYEFIVNGPLDRWLHHVPRGGRSFGWSTRMKIATTLAQGIAFLHDKVKPQVVHRDIRASNVLLDEDFQAHLMGVGLSKFVPWEAMQERTPAMAAGGTYGYLAPEYVYRNELTTKSDVYSFGTLLLEIVSGRRPTLQAASSADAGGWQSIFKWATPLVQAHRWLELLDPVLSSSSRDAQPEAAVVQRVVDLVYACTQNVPSMRPRMSHVVHQLQQLIPVTQPVAAD